jgi:hypothetical protein
MFSQNYVEEIEKEVILIPISTNDYGNSDDNR